MPLAGLLAPLRHADLRCTPADPESRRGGEIVVANIGVSLLVVAFVVWAACAMTPAPSLYAMTPAAAAHVRS